MMGAVVLLGLLSAQCAPDRQGFCRAPTFEVQVNEPTQRLSLNTQLGRVTTLSLMEGQVFSRPPVLGNGAFYKIKVSGGVVSIWARSPGQLSKKEIERHSKTNLQLFLPGDRLLTVSLRIRAPATEHVLIKIPGLSTQAEAKPAQTAEARAIERDALMKQAEDKARGELAEALLGQVHCKDIFDRSMKKFLVLTARRICRLGPYVAITVETLNRARGDLFRMAHLKVQGAHEDESVPTIEAEVAHEGGAQPVLRFKDQVTSVLLFEVQEAYEAASTYAVTVTEAGGKLRKVTVEAEF